MKKIIWMLLLLVMSMAVSATMKIDDIGVVSGASKMINATSTRPCANMTFSVYCTDNNMTGYDTIGVNASVCTDGSKCTEVGATGINSTATFIWNTKKWTDSTACTIQVVCNGSSASDTDTESVTAIDNGIPTCADGTGFKSGDTVAPSATWSVTGTNVTRNGGGLVMGGNKYSLTDSASGYSGKSLVMTFTDDVPESIYSDVYFTVTDGTNMTECTHLSNIRIKDAEGAKQGKILAIIASNQVTQNADGSLSVVSSQKGKLSNTTILLLLAAAMVYFNSSKKGKR